MAEKHKMIDCPFCNGTKKFKECVEFEGEYCGCYKEHFRGYKTFEDCTQMSYHDDRAGIDCGLYGHKAVGHEYFKKYDKMAGVRCKECIDEWGVK